MEAPLTPSTAASVRYALLTAWVLGGPSLAFLALQPADEAAAGPAMLVFILAPATGAWLFSRGLPAVDAPADAPVGSTSALAVRLMLGITLLNLPLALGTGALQAGPGFDPRGAIGGVVSGFLTSALEELGWAAGATRIARAAGGRDGGVFALGFVWAAWHLVVAAFAPPEAVRSMFGTDAALDAGRIASFVAGCVALRFLITALRDRADRLWPAVAAHATGNVVLGALIGGGLVRLDPAAPWWFFPGPTGVGFLALTLGALAWVRRAPSIGEERQVPGDEGSAHEIALPEVDVRPLRDAAVDGAAQDGVPGRAG